MTFCNGTSVEECPTMMMPPSPPPLTKMQPNYVAFKVLYQSLQTGKVTVAERECCLQSDVQTSRLQKESVKENKFLEISQRYKDANLVHRTTESSTLAVQGKQHASYVCGAPAVELANNKTRMSTKCV